MVRPVTERLFEALVLDIWPDSVAAITDFGIESQRHYEALSAPVRMGEITVQQLDDALGSGEKLTALVRSAKSNPHANIVFRTPYDEPSDEIGAELTN